ncbi:actin cytoskeleton organization protein App1 [Fonsecaea pedrosoi]|nr:actin cytoskeleton organization protein App1 [Fonsecaea pedrosoi]
MTSYGGYRAPGARREKVKGYLRAANELRQTYQAQIQQRLQDSVNEAGTSRDWPDVEVVRSENEEMLLFPSYARPHTKRNSRHDDTARYPPGTHESLETPHSSGDADYWKREWEKYEDTNAIVDVDVRGWIYSPQQGPLNRKNRLLVAVARRLSGIYAPTPSPATSRPSSQAPTNRIPQDDSSSIYEDEVAAREAENITRRGQREADAAVKGTYSLTPSGGGTPRGSRSNSPTRSMTTATDFEDEDPAQRSTVKRQSWNEPANMSRDELSAANELLLTRLRPFMSMPTAHVPVTVFFFNQSKSTSKSVTTDESGHFNLRAALDFVPDQVRVLASDKLSAVEDVIVTESKGVSLVSDIDDTIKHSGISSGAREIFKNAFIRELGDLTIKGVKEWYSKLALMGVQFHYVSNSPWQMYPLLRSYFSLAGLPPGSFHLKQYSGMLQGIFEPAAERKRGSLDRIMNDFPERKFILVGDSGEADLEVYTDVVLEHPGRVLGVFIRDVTTPVKKGFFDQAISNTPPDSMVSRDGGRLTRSPGDAKTDAPENRPALPERPRSTVDPKVAEGDLIDFTDDSDATKGSPKPPSHLGDMRQLDTNGKPHAPNKPNKPSSLRNFSTSQLMPPTNHERSLASSDTETQEAVKKKSPPPPPPKPRRSGRTTDANAGHSNSEPVPQPPSRAPFSSPRQNQSQPQFPSDLTRQTSSTSIPPSFTPSVSRTSTTASNSSRADDGYVAVARRQISSAYNALPAIRSSSPTRSATTSSDQAGVTNDSRQNPPLPARRAISSYPAAAARWATGYGYPGSDPLATASDGSYIPPPPGANAPYDKKLEIWRRRWARAEEIMHARGVVLKKWRIGTDVMDECVALVSRELDRQESHDRERHRR